MRKKQAKKQANGKELNGDDAARLEFLKAKNKAAKQAAADADAGEEIAFSPGGGSASGKSAAAEARARLAVRGAQLDTLGDKTADLASAAGEFEAMCKELEKKSR